MNDDGSGQVRLEGDGPVVTMVFDHQARRNAVTFEMWRAVPTLCDRLAADQDVRCVIIRGAGDTAFVAGADISQFGDKRPGHGEYDKAVDGALKAIADLTKPVVAAIHGFCVGGGLALAAVADVRYSAEDAVFCLPPARLGVGYGPSGIGTLVDLLGPAVTKEIIYTADHYDAQTALRWGLVNQVVAKDQLDSFVAERAAMISSRAPLSQKAAKLAVADHLRDPDRRRRHELVAALQECARSDDLTEGIAAFGQKRPPVFRGR